MWSIVGFLVILILLFGVSGMRAIVGGFLSLIFFAILVVLGLACICSFSSKRKEEPKKPEEERYIPLHADAERRTEIERIRKETADRRARWKKEDRKGNAIALCVVFVIFATMVWVLVSLDCGFQCIIDSL